MRRPIAFTLVCLIGFTTLVAFAQDASDDTPAAAKTRKLLETKISLKMKDMRLEDAMDEIKEEHVKGLKIVYAQGVSKNQQVSFTGKDVTLAEALDKLFTKNGLGYYVISKKGNAYDGAIQVKQGKERGFLGKDK